jgi:hypothetical protein
VFFLAFSFSFNFDASVVSAQGSSQEKSEITAPAGVSTSKTTSSQLKNDSCEWLSIGCWAMKLLYAILVVMAFFASVAAAMFSYVIDVKHIVAIMGNPVIWEMWKIVRDFMNLFFIFALLMSAFYTIFQVEKYSYKNVLSKVILGALFVNFSFPIARAIIDVGNVMMYSFIVDIFGMTGKNLTGGILGGSGLMTIFLPGSNGYFSEKLEPQFYIIAIVCMFMFMSSFLTLAVMMLFRLVVLPILVMFSPIGFVAGAVPGMEGYSKQWWDTLIKNVFFGPIAVFMMMIAVKFLSTWGESNKTDFSAQAINTVSGTLISGVVYMTIPIIFFWIAITSAEKLSTEAAGKAGDLVKKLRDIPRKGSRMVGGWAGRKVESRLAKGKYTKFLSPTVVKEAVKAWSETAKHEDMLPIEMAKAEMHNQINNRINKIADSKLGKLLPLHKDRADYAMLEQMKQAKKYEDEIKQRSGGEANEDTTRVILKEALAEHNKAKFMAAASILAKTNGLDNIVGDLGNATEKGMGITGGYATTMKRVMEDLKIDEQLQYKFMHNLGETAKSKGDLAFGDHVTVDASTGIWSINADHDATVATNFKKMKAQTRQDVVHPRAFFEQNINPATGKAEIGDMSLTGSQLAAVINDHDVNSVTRMRGDTQAAFKKIWDELDSPVPAVKAAAHAKYTNFKAAYNNPTNGEFRNYVWQASGHPKGTGGMPPRL